MPIKTISLTHHQKKNIYNQNISGKDKDDLHFKLALSLNDFHLASGLVANRFMQASLLSEADYFPVIKPEIQGDASSGLFMPDDFSIEQLNDLNQELSVAGIELSPKIPDPTYDVIYHQAFNALVFESIDKTVKNHIEQDGVNSEINLLLPSYPYVIAQAGESEFIVPNSIKAASNMVSNSISMPFVFKEIERDLETQVKPGLEPDIGMGR